VPGAFLGSLLQATVMRLPLLPPQLPAQLEIPYHFLHECYTNTLHSISMRSKPKIERQWSAFLQLRRRLAMISRQGGQTNSPTHIPKQGSHSPGVFTVKRWTAQDLLPPLKSLRVLSNLLCHCTVEAGLLQPRKPTANHNGRRPVGPCPPEDQ